MYRVKLLLIAQVLLSIIVSCNDKHDKTINETNKNIPEFELVQIELAVHPLVPSSISLMPNERIIVVNRGFKLFTLPHDNKSLYLEPDFTSIKYDNKEFTDLIEISSEIKDSRLSSSKLSCSIDSLIKMSDFAFVNIHYVYSNDSIVSRGIMDDFTEKERNFLFKISDIIISNANDSTNIKYFKELKNYFELPSK